MKSKRLWSISYNSACSASVARGFGRSDQSQTFSALVGAIWQARDNLAFDVGLRYALVNGRPVNELRAGVTFGFPVSLSRPISGEAPGRRTVPCLILAGGWN